MKLWPRGVDARSVPAARALTLDLPRPIFLTVGRVAVEKNLEAFLALDLPGTKLVVGDGPARAVLARQYPDAVFLGSRQGEALAEIYAAADVFVFPSRTDTFGLVLLEALASGVPVAAFPAAAPRDVIGDAPVGRFDEDLRRACLAALECSRDQCRDFALTHDVGRQCRGCSSSTWRRRQRGKRKMAARGQLAGSRCPSQGEAAKRDCLDALAAICLAALALPHGRHRQNYSADGADIDAAAKRLVGVAVRTPLINAPVLDERLGARVFLKAETLQRTGSFKFRGAYNKISSIPPDRRAAGVVAYSSGNHAQGVAAAAKLLGMPRDHRDAVRCAARQARAHRGARRRGRALRPRHARIARRSPRRSSPSAARRWCRLTTIR